MALKNVFSLASLTKIGSEDQEVYSKCLFRTINYNDLKLELAKAKINYSPSDSYYILTLKLRRAILLKCDVNDRISINLNEEIRAYEESKYSVGSRSALSEALP